MSLYKLSSHNESRPLEFPEDAERYQLFFIDEDESEHAPEYDMGPRNPDEPIGEFSTLAFVLNKKFKQAQKNANENALESKEAELRKKYEQEDKRLLQVVFNTVAITSKMKSIVVQNSAKVGSILGQVSKNKNLNPRKYEYLSLKDDFFHST